MAKENLIARKYAEALAELDCSQASLDDLKLVTETLSQNEDLESSLNSPNVSEAAKFKILEGIFQAKVSANCLNILKLCISKRRTKIIGMLAEHYEAVFFERNNIERACIESPNSIDQAELSEIKSQLEKLFNKEIELEAQTNPGLIAGVKINVNNKIIDYSLNSKIKKLKQSLNS